MAERAREFLKRYFGALDELQGWFSPEAAILFIAYNELATSTGGAGDVLEIGVYHGKSAVLLGSLRGVGRRLVAADLFDSTQSFDGAENGPGVGPGMGPDVGPDVGTDVGPDVPDVGMKASFLKVMRRFYNELDFLQLVSGSSGDLDADSLGSRFSFCHIDGDHTAAQTYQDMELCAHVSRDGGLIAMDDYFNPLFPGVSEAAHRFSTEHPGELIPIAIGFNKAIFQKAPAPFDLKSEFARRFESLPRHSTQLWEQPVHLFLSSLLPFVDLERSTPMRLCQQKNLEVNALIEPRTCSIQAGAGQMVNLPVLVTNQSSIPFNWGIALSYHLFSASNAVVQWDNGRYVFEPPLDTGGQRVVNVGVRAPEKPGEYRLEMDLVWDGVTWFKDRGSPTSMVDLRVS